VLQDDDGRAAGCTEAVDRARAAPMRLMVCAFVAGASLAAALVTGKVLPAPSCMFG
jgi:hypothetical protein